MNVTIDKDFARFGSKSYAINKINTVDVVERQPHGKAAIWIFGILAGLFGLSGIGSLVAGNEGASSSIGMAVIFAGVAYWAWKRSKIVEYQLFLMTSSSSAQAITSRDGEMIYDLRQQIEKAMVAA